MGKEFLDGIKADGETDITEIKDKIDIELAEAANEILADTEFSPGQLEKILNFGQRCFLIGARYTLERFGQEELD